ncbi:MAG: leucyl aminopeptidase [Bryobacteraceae bacterium]
MQIRFESGPVEKLSADALVVICFEAEIPAETMAVEATTTSDPEIARQSGWLAELRASGEFTGKLYEQSTLFRPEGATAKRLVVIGGGKKEKFSSVEARRLAGVAVRTLQPKGLKTVVLALPADSGAEIGSAAAEGAILGGWEPEKYKSDPNKNSKRLETFVVAAPSSTTVSDTAIQRAQIIAEAQNFSRDLVNEPANRLTPAALAEAAQEMAAQSSLDCEILDQAAMEKLGMGALLGVARGSSNPPFLIVLKYRPAGAFGSDHLALIGKGVTFDTGGISIKPADGMEKMKYDMAGAGATLGAMKAIAQLKPAVQVTAYIPAVENMINGDAQRPGDIVTSLAGKTIEVLNTDAEGRLILADAITYAKQNGATHLVDAATLTGAIGIALGHHNMGAFTNSQGFLDNFLSCARSAGEKAWQLPMDEEYKDYLKSPFADLPNIGGRYGGSITAAWFLREFADPTPWVHLDIASTAWLDDGRAWLSKGPSGVAVRSFVQLALGWNGNQMY